MKILFHLSVFLCAFGTFAQEYSVDLLLITRSDGEADTTYLQFARAPKKLAARLTTSDFSEQLILDSVQGKMLELIAEDGEKEAYLGAVKTADDQPHEVAMTDVYDMLANGQAEASDYKLLPDKKIIKGLECRKIELLEEGAAIGTAWIAPELSFGIGKGNGAFKTPHGMIVELTFEEEGDLFSIFCTRITRGSVPAGTFSLNIPEGYTLMDTD